MSATCVGQHLARKNTSNRWLFWLGDALMPCFCQERLLLQQQREKWPEMGENLLLSLKAAGALGVGYSTPENGNSCACSEGDLSKSKSDGDATAQAPAAPLLGCTGA